MAKYLDGTGLGILWDQIKNTFALSGHNHDNAYVKIDGSTKMTGPLTIQSSINNNYNEGIRIEDAGNKWAGITLGAVGTAGITPQAGEVAWFIAKRPGGGFIIAPNSSSNDTGLHLTASGDIKWRTNVMLHLGNYTSYCATANHGHSNYLPKAQVSSPQDSTYGDSNISWAIDYAASYPQSFVYNNYGAEYSYLIGMNSNNNYGTILKMGYADRYLRILRKINTSWQSTDWEKIYAGYADSAGSVAWSNITSKPDSFTPSTHDHDGRYIKWGGSAADTSAMTWGTLTSANGYTALSHTSSSDGGDWGMVNKGGQIFMQLDGYYYQNEGRYRVLDTSDSSSFAPSNHTHSYIPLSGGAITGQITRDSGGSWISGRDTAIIRTTRTSNEGSDWHPAVAIKTSVGCWSFGSVGGETLALSYDTDENYSNSNNDSAVIWFPTAGSSGTLALTSDIAAAVGSYLPLSGGTMTGTIKYGGASYEIIRTGGDDTSWRGGLKYSWSSNTTIALWGKHVNSQFVWHAGSDFSTSDVNGTTTRNYDFQIGRNGSNVLEGLIGGNLILHAGNYSSYALPLSGGTLTGNLTATNSYIKAGGNGLQYPIRITRAYNDSVDFLIGSASPEAGSNGALDMRISNNESGGGGEVYIDLKHGGGGVNIYPSLTVGGYGVITSNNIGSQSVNYATSAGNLKYTLLSTSDNLNSISNGLYYHQNYDRPANAASYNCAIIQIEGRRGYDYHQFELSANEQCVFYRGGSGGSWTDWKKVAFTTDLPTKDSWNYDDQYLKLSGGTLTGTSASLLTINSSNNDNYITFRQSGSMKGYIGWENTTGVFMQAGSRYIHVTDAGDLRFYDSSSDRVVLHTGNYTSYCATSSHNHDSSYLKLTGGTITGTLESTGTKLVATNQTYNTSISLFSSQNVGIWNEKTSSWILKFDGSWLYRNDKKIWDEGNLDPSSFSSASHNHDGAYLKLSGGTLTGALTITDQISIQTQTKTKSYPTSQQLVINGPDYVEGEPATLQSAPGIGFHYPNRTWASLVWYDGAFCAVASDFSGYTRFRGSGFIKSGSDDSYVLLGGGGHKAESSLNAGSIGGYAHTAFVKKSDVVDNLRVSYNALAAKYCGGTNPVYWRITIPKPDVWCMIQITCSLIQSYTDGKNAKIVIYGTCHGRADWHGFRANVWGYGDTIKVYGSDKKYIYIYTNSAWETLSVDKIIVSDGITGQDISAVSIDWVSELPATYQTADTMYGLHTGNFSSYAATSGHDHDSRYLKLTGGTLSNTLIITGESNWREGIRINDASNGWATLTMGGSATSGTGANIWSLHTYQGNFYLAKNGSDSFTEGISHTSGRWLIKGSGNNYEVARFTGPSSHTGISIEAASSNNPFIRFANGNGYNSEIGFDASRGNFYIGQYNSAIGVVNVNIANSKVGIGTSSPETTLDVNGVQQIYQRGNDNTAFKDLLLLKQQNSSEDSGQNFSTTYPSFGIGFRRYWTSSNGPYGETTCAGIYTTMSSSWRGGLIFRTKNNETQGGTHDTTALRLRPDGVAEFTRRIDAANLGNTASYEHAAIQIREYGLGGAQSDTWGNAPRLAWNWAGRVQTQIGLASSQDLFVSKDNFSHAYRIVTEEGKTWGINISGNAGSATNASNADTVDGYHASGLVKFYLSPMSSSAPADSAKSWFVNTMPSSSGAIVYNVPGSEKTIIAGKSSGSYGHMLQLNYDDNYLRILRYAGGSWKTTDWEKISAGNSDALGGISASGFVRQYGGVDKDFNIPDGGSVSGIYYVHSSYTQSNYPSRYGLIADFNSGVGHLQFFGGGNNSIKVRSYWWTSDTNFSGYSSWVDLIHSGNIASSIPTLTDSEIDAIFT